MVKRYWLLLVGVALVLAGLSLLAFWVYTVFVSDRFYALDAGNPLKRLAASALAVVILMSLGVWAMCYHYRHRN
jgi:hypothetical protein